MIRIVSFTETHVDQGTARTCPQADELLRDLESDRRSLISRLKTPWNLMIIQGGTAAAYVAQAAFAPTGAEYRPSRVHCLSFVVVLVVCSAIQRHTGLRFKRSGARARRVFAAWAVSPLVSKSVAKGWQRPPTVQRIRMIPRFFQVAQQRGAAFAADMDTLVATPIGASPRTKRMEQVLALEGAAAPTVVLAGGRYPWRAARPVGHVRRARPGRGPRPPGFARGAARARGRRLGRPITGRSLRPRPWPDPGSSRPGTG